MYNTWALVLLCPLARLSCLHKRGEAPHSTIDGISTPLEKSRGEGNPTEQHTPKYYIVTLRLWEANEQT